MSYLAACAQFWGLAHRTRAAELSTISHDCRLQNAAKKGQAPVHQEGPMSGGEMEDWWSLSPEDLAIVQADPHYKPDTKAQQGKLPANGA